MIVRPPLIIVIPTPALTIIPTTVIRPIINNTIIAHFRASTTLLSRHSRRRRRPSCNDFCSSRDDKLRSRRIRRNICGTWVDGIGTSFCCAVVLIIQVVENVFFGEAVGCLVATVFC
jgi:hypothetical protein